jgi:CDP-diglyceride synthetase
MFSDKLLDNSMGWFIFLIATLLMLLGNYYGYKIGLWHQKRNPEATKSSNNEIMGAIFGVLGFTLAFLFGMSLTRLEHKKEMVMEESSAVLAAYQHAQFLPEPFKSKTGSMLMDYGKLRFQIATNARADGDSKTLQAGILQCESIQDALLKIAMEISNNSETDVSDFKASVSALMILICGVFITVWATGFQSL